MLIDWILVWKVVEMIDNRTRKNLVVAFGIMLAFIISLTSAGGYLLASGIQRVEDVVAQNIRKSQLISDMRIAARLRSLTLSQMLLIDDPFDRDEEFIRFNALGTDFILAQNALKTAMLSKKEHDIFEASKPLSIKIGQAQKRIIQHIENENFAEGIVLQVKGSIPLQKETDKLFLRMQTLQREGTSLEVNSAVEEFRVSLYILLGTSLFILMVMAIIGRFVVRYTTQSEQRIFREKERTENALKIRQSELERLVRRRTVELTEAKEYAEHASETKTNFLSRMSHELRTPLNAILGFSQLTLLDTEKTLTESQVKNVAEIEDAGNYLLELINELLDLATIESGRLELAAEPLLLFDVVKESITMILPLAKQRNIAVINEITEKAPTVFVDKLRLKQVLINILANAIKYNYENGSVYINAQIGMEGIVRLTIKDTGIGISDENKNKVFNDFERLSSHAGIEGNGIGLSVTRHLVELMGGEIGVDNKIDTGCIFWVEFPIKK